MNPINFNKLKCNYKTFLEISYLFQDKGSINRINEIKDPNSKNRDDKYNI